MKYIYILFLERNTNFYKFLITETKLYLSFVQLISSTRGILKFSNFLLSIQH